MRGKEGEARKREGGEEMKKAKGRDRKYKYLCRSHSLPKALAMAILSRKLMKGATTIPMPISCTDTKITSQSTHTHLHGVTKLYVGYVNLFHCFAYKRGPE